jgi:hypothetical protein
VCVGVTQRSTNKRQNKKKRNMFGESDSDEEEEEEYTYRLTCFEKSLITLSLTTFTGLFIALLCKHFSG